MKKVLIVFVLCLGFSIMASAQDAGDFETTVENGAVTITGFWGAGVMTNVRIPAEIDGLPVKIIGDNAFSDSRLTSITIPNSVTSIGEEAFASNKLTSVTIPNSVTSIGGRAFANNPLTSLTIGNSVTTIGESAFANNRLTRVTIPNSVTSIGEEAFSMGAWKEGVILTRVVIGSNVNFVEGRFSFGGGGVFAPDNHFQEYYNNNNKRAGTYIYTGDWSYRP
jgi:hypothetical protein